jgi:secreted trypsin-like serine protease
VIAIETSIVHPDFFKNESMILNDIALLRLSRRAEYNYFVQPVCLAYTQQLRDRDINGFALDYVGWPRTVDGSGKRSNIKLRVPITITDMSNCPRRRPTGANLICGQGEVNATCVSSYNVGGGLFKDHVDGKLAFWYLAGVVSVGNCEATGVGLFTNVNKYYTWIEQNVHE